jgi:hypothetical protein
MFGNTQPPANPEPAEPQPTKPMSVLGEQTQSFFSSFGGKVSAASAPRPVRPGTTLPPRPAPYVRPAPSTPSSFVETSAEAARLRAEAEAAEADFVDDFFDEGDAPSC